MGDWVQVCACRMQGIPIICVKHAEDRVGRYT